MKIAVISDTHDRMPPGLPDRLTRADEIWHLGDVCHPDTLLSIEALGIRMRIISGNCDYMNLWPGAMGVSVGGLHIHLEHIAPNVAPKGADLVLSGHTHCPERRDVDGVTWLNPGCISMANRGAPASFAWLEVKKDASWTWELELV